MPACLSYTRWPAETTRPTASLPPSRPSSPPTPQVLPKREGLLHVSEWGYSRVQNIADLVKEGDLIDVMITEVQDGGKFKLSRKAVLVADGVPPPAGVDLTAAGPAGNGGRREREREPPAVMPVVGGVYRNCRIKQILPFGAFVEVGVLRLNGGGKGWAERRT